jgi:hypothetical protein
VQAARPRVARPTSASAVVVRVRACMAASFCLGYVYVTDAEGF